MKLKLFVFSFLFSTLAWGQASLPVSRTTWDAGPPTGWTDNTFANPAYTTVFACSGMNGGRLDNSAEYFQVFFSGVPNQLSYVVKVSGASASTLLVQESPDGSSWTTVATNPLTTSCVTFNYTLNSSTRYVRWTYTKVTQNMTIDDVLITASSGIPVVSVSPATLSGFTYVVGTGPSGNQSFTASGSDLTGNLDLSAPSNYEIATVAGGPYGASVSLTPTAGTVSATTIFVRLKAGLSVGTYNAENIVASSAGATSQNVICNGNVTGSLNSDVVAVGGSESVTVSSTINNNAPLTSATGVQVWQFTVRDGGVGLNDADNLPTILTDFTLAQAGGNAIGTWSDAINTIELFDGLTRIAAATVTANQIQFTGLNISVADNTSKTLSLRLSLKCPLGADAFDGEDFVFSLSNANTTFSAAGSGKSAFAAAVSANGQNMIAVVATRLAFTTQPNTTGINATMSNVVVTATDACGNKDVDFTGTVNLTSTGTMTGAPLNVVSTAGVATFSGIIHTVLGTGLTLSASSPGLTTAVSSLFDITPVTSFAAGDFAVIAVNSNITCYPAGPNGVYSAGDDEISFMIFKDIQNGDTFYISDNGYERATVGLWGDTEGVTQIVRTGGTIPAGTIITIRLRNVAPIMEFVSPDTNWSFSKAAGFAGNLVMNAGGDQIFFMQGGVWNNPGGAHDATYTPGTYLYAFNTNTAWNSLGLSTQQSALPIELRCFSLMPGSATDFLEYVGPTTPAVKLDWIARLNSPSNWIDRVNCAGYTQMHNGMSYTVLTGGTFVDGVWTGAKSTDWFDCANWQTLEVPTPIVDVDINTTYGIRDAVVDATSPNASIYGNIAQSNNISISGNTLVVEGNTNNKLEVYGNLSISGTGAVDMEDASPLAADGQIYLRGNWSNGLGNNAFLEGNGTVHFTGTTPQVINNVTPVGTEVFYNVVMNNNFDTAVSNDLIASNNLTVSGAKTLTVDSAGYVQVNNALTNNGSVNIADNGQFIQINEADTNAGTYAGTAFQVNRNADNIRSLDYVFWGSPVENYDIANINGTLRYYWDTTFINPNGTEGYWLNASGNMVKGRGYIVRAPSSFSTPQTLLVTFSGKPYNGQFNYAATRGTNGASNNDNLVLVGNPYASAIDADVFISENSSDIEGAVRLWTHGTLPSSAILSPFYENFAVNYTANDYVVYNGTATTIPAVFDGKIASGQGFFVTLLESGAAAKNIVFKNNMRGNAIVSNVHDNTQFFKSSAIQMGVEKNRIWLDLIDQSNNVAKTVVGYVSGATMQKDNYYDAYAKLGSGLSFYSMIEEEAIHIQGRALPFNVDDKIPLGIEIPEAGNHTIAISYLDGLFSGNQNIYLEDLELHLIHDLKANPYHFNSATTGFLNHRFQLRFTTEALETQDVAQIANAVTVYAQEGIHVTSKFEKIQSVSVYDILGRQLAEKKNVGEHVVVLSDITASKSTYIVKVVLENGTKVDKKIVY